MTPTEKLRQRLISVYTEHQPFICLEAGIKPSWLHAFRYGSIKSPGHDIAVALERALDAVDKMATNG